MKKLKIAIIGGYGGMGKFFARIFKNEGFDVIITGPSEEKGRRVARELGVYYVRNNPDAAGDSDIVIVSVPISETINVIKEVAPHVKEGSLLMDVTSIKEKPCKAMEKFSRRGVEIIGTHPVFSHRVGTLEGQVFILTPIRGKKWLNWLKEFLNEHKVRVYESTPEEHDRIMAVVQGLTHFAYISIGKTLQELNFDIRESRKFSSPIYELMLDMVGRIIGQNPRLYAEIQMENPRVNEVHEKFLETAKKLSEIIREGDEKKFIEIMKDAARHFDDVERAMGRSDKAIFSLIHELETLRNSIGRELCIRHIYSGNVHVGILKDVTAESIILEDNKHRYELKLSNIQIVDGRERMRLRIEKFGTVSRDFSVIFDSNVDEKFISELLMDYDENITEVRIKDIYSGPQIEKGKKSICFGIKIINSKPKKTEMKIIEFLERLGGRLR